MAGIILRDSAELATVPDSPVQYLPDQATIRLLFPAPVLEYHSRSIGNPSVGVTLFGVMPARGESHRPGTVSRRPPFLRHAQEMRTRPHVSNNRRRGACASEYGTRFVFAARRQVSLSAE